MEKDHNAYLEKVRTKIADAKISQLAMAAPLESGSALTRSKSMPSVSTDNKKASEPGDFPTQKIGLLTALLSVGALRPAIVILTKFPWAVDAHPEIADLLIRVLKHSISALYDSNFVTKERNTSFTQPRARYIGNRITTPPPRKPVLTLWAPTPPNTAATDFVFFYPDWTEWVPICLDLEDVADVVAPLLKFVGVHVHRDTLFLTKLSRLGKLHLMTTVSIQRHAINYRSLSLARVPMMPRTGST